MRLAEPDADGTVFLVIMLLVTAAFLSGETAYEVASRAAIGIGVGLIGLVAMELRHSWRNIFKADLLALCSLYFLTFFEFLFDQPAFSDMLTAELTMSGVALCLWSFGGIAVGRHLPVRRSSQLSYVMDRPVSPELLIRLFWVCMALGYFYMLHAVSFNPVHMVEAMMEPRFSQPWQRGRFGGWPELLYEMSMLLYLVPPMAGVIIARRNRFSSGQVLGVVLGFLFVLSSGFVGGTRKVFAAYLVTFLVGYCLALPKDERKKAVIAVAAGAGALVLATRVMLNFRERGLLNYLRRGGGVTDRGHLDSELFVDYNLYVISRLTTAFPENHPFLGLEIPYLALIRPIPRAIWPGKPEGMTFGIEEALGADNLTLAATFIGEAYISGGVIGILVIAALIGVFAQWWSQHGSMQNSDLGMLIYASGFFAVTSAMRSLLSASTAMLPTIAAIVVGYLLVRRAASRRRGPSGQRLVERSAAE